MAHFTACRRNTPASPSAVQGAPSASSMKRRTASLGLLVALAARERRRAVTKGGASVTIRRETGRAGDSVCWRTSRATRGSASHVAQRQMLCRTVSQPGAVAATQSMARERSRATMFPSMRGTIWRTVSVSAARQLRRHPTTTASRSFSVRRSGPDASASKRLSRSVSAGVSRCGSRTHSDRRAPTFFKILSASVTSEAGVPKRIEIAQIAIGVAQSLEDDKGIDADDGEALVFDDLFRAPLDSVPQPSIDDDHEIERQQIRPVDLDETLDLDSTVGASNPPAALAKAERRSNVNHAIDISRGDLHGDVCGRARRR